MFSRGDKIKEYEVIAPLRSGGMAMLYLARRRGVGGFSRLVALKLVHSHLADDASINRLFLQEARITASVAHPNVVNVEEVGTADGHYFMAMEYVHGVSLAELLASLHKCRLRMSAKLCVWVAAHVAEALHAAHEATGENGAPLQIVHRDVSPQNVLIGHNGHVKLIDFGIAKSHSVGRHATGGGTVLGKLGYMAPEQLRAGPVDRRTDVYALGVMLWEMLTSRSLFRCIRIDDERDWATRESPPPPSRYSPISTAALDRVVCRAISFGPHDRYHSALEFRAALLQAIPAAAEVDAPRFAALMRTMLGDELERRRASWPSEVSVQLDMGQEKTTGRALNIEELTTRLRSSEAPDAPEDDDEPTTVKESPAVARSEWPREDSAEAAEPAYVVTAASIGLRTPRLGVPAVRVVPLRSTELSAMRGRQLGLAFAALCAAIVTFIAAPVASPRGRLNVRMEVGAVSSSRPREVRVAIHPRERRAARLLADAGSRATVAATPVGQAESGPSAAPGEPEAAPPEDIESNPLAPPVELAPPAAEEAALRSKGLEDPSDAHGRDRRARHRRP